jgi:hypothetical protein
LRGVEQDQLAFDAAAVQTFDGARHD